MMRQRFYVLLAATAIGLSACGGATTGATTPAAASPDIPTTAGAAATTAPVAGTIQVTDVWARAVTPMSGMGSAQPTSGAMGAMESTATAMGAMESTAGAMGAMDGTNGAVYMIIRNTGSTPDRLIKATSNVARSVELHTVEKKGEVMSMHPVENIEIPASGQAELKPGGFHVMLIGLTRDLKPGDTFDITLQFEQAGTLDVQAEVRQQ